MYPGSHGVTSLIWRPAAGERLRAPCEGMCRRRVGLKSEMMWSPDERSESKEVLRVSEVRRVEELNLVEFVETELLRVMVEL